jgi:hypothetical protein
MIRLNCASFEAQLKYPVEILSGWIRGANRAQNTAEDDCLRQRQNGAREPLSGAAHTLDYANGTAENNKNYCRCVRSSR